MLKGIPSILPPELLKILMEMGHGDELVLADGNFPKFAHPQHVVRCDGHTYSTAKASSFIRFSSSVVMIDPGLTR